MLSRLDAELAGSARFQAIRWEEGFYSAHATFQAQIASPAEADLAVFIFWSRAGTALPSDFLRRADGSSYISGVEYEFESALQGHRARGTPDVFAYRKTAKILFEADRIEQQQAQLQALEALWTRQFSTESGLFASGFSTFNSTDEFEALFERQILLSLPTHRRRSWVLHLHPKLCPTRPIRRALVLADNAFELQAAGVLEHERSVIVLQVLVDPPLREADKSSNCRRGR